MADAVKIRVKEVEDGIDGAPPWITTFVDMVSLLVTFFILLFTFSAISDHEEFTYPRNLIGTSGLNRNSGDTLDAPDTDVMAAMDVERGARNPHSRPKDQLAENLEEMGQKLIDEDLELDASDVRDGLRLSFGPEACFAPGSAEPSPELARCLEQLGEVLQHYRHVVVIEGFTDSAFRATREHPTAEALSLARAVAAARLVLERSELSPKLVQIAGLGAERPLFTADATALERRLERRVEVVIRALSKSRAAAIEAESGSLRGGGEGGR